MFDVISFLNITLLLVIVVVVGVWRKKSKPKMSERLLLKENFYTKGLCMIYKNKADLKKIEQSFLLIDPPKDTVVLHQYGAAPFVPSISPFVMKLETYLRVADIPYVNKFDRWPGPKDKLPWVQYNHHVVPDSQKCIEFLNEECRVDLNKQLCSYQLALGHLVRRTCEDSLYWVLLMWRLVLDKKSTIFRNLSIPVPVIWYMRKVSFGKLWSQGIGRHSEQEVTQIMEDDLAALSSIIGDQKFIFGDTRECATEFDCAVFGQLCQLVWQMPGCPVQEIITKKYPNLVRFCENMKSAFWPDWDERLLYAAGKVSSNK